MVNDGLTSKHLAQLKKLGRGWETPGIAAMVIGDFHGCWFQAWDFRVSTRTEMFRESPIAESFESEIWTCQAFDFLNHPKVGMNFFSLPWSPWSVKKRNLMCKLDMNNYWNPRWSFNKSSQKSVFPFLKKKAWLFGNLFLSFLQQGPTLKRTGCSRTQRPWEISRCENWFFDFFLSPVSSKENNPMCALFECSLRIEHPEKT